MATPLGMAVGVGLIALVWAGIAALWLRQAREVRRAAEALGLREAEGSTRLHPRFEGLWEGAPLALRVVTTGAGKHRWVVLEAPCAAPAGFVLALAEDAVFRAQGVPLRGLREVRTGWKHFDGWAWPRSNDELLARAFLRRCRAALNGNPMGLWVHAGRLGLSVGVVGFRAAEAPRLALALRQRAAELAEAAADPRARAEAAAPDTTPESFGADEALA